MYMSMSPQPRTLVIVTEKIWIPTKTNATPIVAKVRPVPVGPMLRSAKRHEVAVMF
jgi:hypothetical protein